MAEGKPRAVRNACVGFVCVCATETTFSTLKHTYTHIHIHTRVAKRVKTDEASSAAAVPAHVDEGVTDQSAGAEAAKKIKSL